ncbi:TIGR04222 domain-containing membrane protein [Nonomuraea sp. PA05]|uniref:TIGR04222 domain-containing membrane protein n=1 Tax=Nonomuraea sp. PA05 TaxID=2604466 RepID=UPI0011D665F5|nr:TIGR04222 domain-containing membrane protein [Nonomuraea sp. PA05]TYB70145.1 TIGR04222 domain-containing membrane protein [Nonomuraea sp. PA05]
MVTLVAAVLVLGLVAVAALALVEILLRRQRQEGTITGAYELAVLITGHHSLPDTVITALVRRNAVRESRSGLCAKVAGASAEDPAERLVLDFLTARGGRAARHQIARAPGWPSLEKRMRAELRRRGLLRPHWMSWTIVLSALTVFPVLLTNVATLAIVLDIAGDLLSGETSAAWAAVGQWWPALLVPPLTVTGGLVIEWMRAPDGDRTLVGQAVYHEVLAAHPDHDGSLESYVLRGDPQPGTVPAPTPARESPDDDGDADGGGDGGGGGCGCGCGDA